MVSFLHAADLHLDSPFRALPPEQMLALVSQVAPTLFAQAGPGCVRGACPEGKMSCGRADQVRRRMEALRGGRQP